MKTDMTILGALEEFMGVAGIIYAIFNNAMQ